MGTEHRDEALAEFTLIPAMKVSPPALGSLRATVPRERLVERVRQGRDTRLVLVSGGAGMGKTTLLTQLAARTDRTLLWLNLDEEDGNAPNFAALMLTAIQRRQPAAGSALERFLASGLDPSASITVMANLMADLFSQLDPFMMVVDDFHLAASAPAVIAFIERLIERFPPRHQLVLSSRRQFPFNNLPQWRTRQWCIEINEQDLLFAEEEMAALLSAMLLPQPNVELAQRLLRLTGGWIGLTILLLTRPASIPISDRSLNEFTDPDARPRLIEYVIREILDELPQNYRNFIVQTSVLDLLNPAEVNEILGFENSAALLRALAQDNWFTIRYSTEPEEYRFHELLREAALLLLEQQTGSNGLRILRQHVAGRLAEMGKWFEATAQLIRAQDWEQAAESLDAAIARLPRTSIQNRVISQVARIPDAHIVSRPRLLLLKAKAAFLRRDLDEALRAAQLAQQSFFDRGDPSGTLEACWQKLTVMKARPRKEELAAAAREGLDMAGHVNTIHGLLIRMLWLRYEGSLAEFHNMKTLLERSLSLAISSHDRIRVAEEHIHLALLYHITLGEFETAAGIIQHQLPVFEEYGHAEALSNAVFNLAICYFHLGKLDEAERTFLHALSICEQYQTDLYRQSTRAFLAAMYAEQGRFDEALTLIKRIETALANTPFGYTHNDLLFARAAYHAARNEETAALDSAGRYLEICRSTASETIIAQALTNKGEILSRFRRWEAAGDCLTEALALFTRSGRLYGQAYCHLTLALPLIETLAPAPLEHLRLGLQLARENTFTDLLLSRKDHIRLLVIALTHRVEFDFVLGLLARIQDLQVLVSLLDHPDPRVQQEVLSGFEARGQIGDVLPHVAQLANRGRRQVRAFAREIIERQKHISLPLYIQCFGRFEVRIGDSAEPISDTRWRLSRARQIFKYLLIHRQQPVHQEVLIDRFWPDADVAAGVKNIHNTIACLRRALRPEWNISGQGPYVISHERHYRLLLPPGSEVDYDKFDEALRHCAAAMAEGDLALAQTAFNTAAQLFSGDFMPEDPYDDWLEPRRQSFRTRFQDSGLRLGSRLLKSGFADDTVDVAHQLLSRDPVNEDAVSLAIHARITSGHPAMARALFENYRKVLQAELHTEPSDYLCRLYQRLSPG